MKRSQDKIVFIFLALAPSLAASGAERSCCLVLEVTRYSTDTAEPSTY